MTNPALLRLDRDITLRRFRVPTAIAAAAVLGLSLLLSVGPALAAANNGNNGNGGSSNVKVHNASTGIEALGSDNEPHVCDFWLEFSVPDPFEAGSWLLLSWAPTGDGSTVASGTYNTTGDGTDSTSIIHVAAGHYRVEWAATGETVTKKKTFWVDSDCSAAATPAEETQPEEPAGSADESPADESPAEASPVEEPTSPSDELADSAPEPPEGSPDESAAVNSIDESPSGSPVGESSGESPTEEPATPPGESGGEAPTGDEPPASNEQDVLSDTGSGAESPADEPGAPTDEPADDESPADEPAVEEPDSPGDDAPAAQGDGSASDGGESQGVAGDEPTTPPAQDQLDSRNDRGGSTMPDTATSPQPVSNGLLATLMLLLLVAAHASFRRSGHAERE